jgi:hypothetical protein
VSRAARLLERRSLAWRDRALALSFGLPPHPRAASSVPSTG